MEMAIDTHGYQGLHALTSRTSFGGELRQEVSNYVEEWEAGSVVSLKDAQFQVLRSWLNRNLFHLPLGSDYVEGLNKDVKHLHPTMRARFDTACEQVDSTRASQNVYVTKEEVGEQ